MSSGFDEYWDRKIRQNNIPPEFGGVSGKNYEQLEFEFGEDPFDFLYRTDAQLDGDKRKANLEAVVKREEATNLVMQANAIIKLVMDNIGEGNRDFDSQEFALWGASELLEKATSVLE